LQTSHAEKWKGKIWKIPLLSIQIINKVKSSVPKLQVVKYPPHIQIRDFNAKFVIYGFSVALCNILTTILELKVKQNLDRSQAVLHRGNKKELLEEIMAMLVDME